MRKIILVLSFLLSFQAEAQEQENENDSGLRNTRDPMWFIGGLYSTAKDLKFTDSKVSGITGEFTYETESTWGLTAGLYVLPQDSLGFMGSFNYEHTRKVKSFSAVLGGTSASGSFSGDQPEITIITLDGNVAYRWEQFYSFIGLNSSGVVFKQPSGGGDVEANGSIGLQFGAGYFITDNLAADLQMKTISMTVRNKDSSVDTNFGLGTLTGTNLVVKYIFP